MGNIYKILEEARSDVLYQLMKIILLLLLLISASAIHAQNTFRGSFPRGVLRLPLVYQTTDYTCGPAAMLSLLRYFQVADELTEQSLASEMLTTYEWGTNYLEMQKALAKRGLSGEIRLNSTLENVQSEIVKGNPVIVNFKSYNVGHYAIAIALNDKYIYMMDPWFARRGAVRMKREDFIRSWYDEHAGIRLDGMMIIARRNAVER